MFDTHLHKTSFSVNITALVLSSIIYCHVFCVLQEIALDFAMIRGPQAKGLALERSLRPRASCASPVKWATSCGARPSGRVCSMDPGQDCSPCAKVSGSQPESQSCRLKPGSSLWNDQWHSATSYRLCCFYNYLVFPSNIRESSGSLLLVTVSVWCSGCYGWWGWERRWGCCEQGRSWRGLPAAGSHSVHTLFHLLFTLVLASWKLKQWKK